jgi:hypothetical protein
LDSWTAACAGRTASAYTHQRDTGTSRNTANMVAFGSQKIDVRIDGYFRRKPSSAPP